MAGIEEVEVVVAHSQRATLRVDVFLKVDGGPAHADVEVRAMAMAPISRDGAKPGLVAAFGDDAFADSALDTWAGFVHKPEPVTSTVSEITGSPARSLREWAADHAGDFR